MILIGRGLDFRLERETDWMKEQRKPGQKLNQFDTLCGCQSAERRTLLKRKGFEPEPEGSAEGDPGA